MRSLSSCVYYPVHHIPQRERDDMRRIFPCAHQSVTLTTPTQIVRNYQEEGDAYLHVLVVHFPEILRIAGGDTECQIGRVDNIAPIPYTPPPHDVNPRNIAVLIRDGAFVRGDRLTVKREQPPPRPSPKAQRRSFP